MEAMSREFPRRMMDEYSPPVRRHLHVGDVDDGINWKEVEKHRQPLYSEWDTEIIHRAARLDLEMEALVPPAGVARREER